MALQPTISPTLVRWNLNYLNDRSLLSDYELEYVLDGDDPVARAARANVLIAPADPVVAAVAQRSDLDYDETADMLEGFMAALERAEAGAA